MNTVKYNINTKINYYFIKNIIVYLLLYNILYYREKTTDIASSIIFKDMTEDNKLY